MTEPGPEARATAGALLRAARERHGLHIAALAAAIKVAPRKLDALEHDRYDELPDATFTRALAQTVCRTLKIDAGPVLALLPQPDLGRLENVAGTLNTPFRDRPGRDDSSLAVSAIRPLVWASALLMAAALVVHFLPAGLWDQTLPAAPSASVPAALPSAAASAAMLGEQAASATAAAVPAASASGDEPVAAVAPSPAASSAALPERQASVPAMLLQMRASVASWVKVEDGRGQQLLMRTLQPGEVVALDGALPLRLTIGNAAGVQLSFRGRPVDLQAVTRDNVARVELK